MQVSWFILEFVDNIIYQQDPQIMLLQRLSRFDIMENFTLSPVRNEAVLQPIIHLNNLILNHESKLQVLSVHLFPGEHLGKQ